MPNYTFRCQSCGDFTIWHKSSKGNKQEAECPNCYTVANRIFTPPITYRMDSKLKRTIESGMEPKLVTKENMPKQSIRKKPRVTRPWQAGH